MKIKQQGQAKSSGKHPDRAEVAQRAYEFYEARGGEPGHELEDWLRAEQELDKRAAPQS